MTKTPHDHRPHGDGRIREGDEAQTLHEENITCPRCRFRHPASRSCEESKRLAAVMRLRPYYFDSIKQTGHSATMVANTEGGYVSWDDYERLRTAAATACSEMGCFCPQDHDQTPPEQRSALCRLGDILSGDSHG